jgi:hypothetical protein
VTRLLDIPWNLLNRFLTACLDRQPVPVAVH